MRNEFRIDYTCWYMNTTLKGGLKWLVIAGLFAIPFIPFVISRSLLFPFITGKAFAFRMIVEIIFAAWALLALADAEYRPKWNAITKSVLAFTVIVLLADIFSIYPFKSLWSNYERMEGFVTIAHLAAYYFVASSVLVSMTWWKRFWNTELIAATGVAFYGFLQLAGKITVNQGGVRLDATFGNAAYLGIYAVFNIFVAAMLFSREKRSVWKWVYAIVIALQGIVLYFTATRGAILGLIGGAILTALIILIKAKRSDLEKKTVRRMAIGLLLAIVVVVGGFFMIRNTQFVQTSPVLARFRDFSLSSQQNQGRSYVWPMALKGVSERPILGWGQESFNYVFNQNYNPAAYSQEQWFDRTHDVFLDWLISAGVLGLLAYVSLFVTLLYLLFKKSGFSLEEKALMVGLLAAYVFHNIFVFDNLISYILFFSLLAWVSTNAAQHSVGSEKAASSAKAARHVSPETINYLALPAIGIALILCLYFVNVPALSAGRNLIQGISNQNAGPQANLDYFKKVFAAKSFGSSEALEQLTNLSVQVIQSQNQQVTPALKESFFNLTDEQIKAQIQRTPTDARYLLLAGSFYNRMSRYDDAIVYLTEAVKASPKKPAMYFELATSYLGKGDTTKAFELFTTGYNLAPEAPDSQIIYAVGAIYAQKADVVSSMFQKIGEEKVVGDDRILTAYVNTKQFSQAISLLNLRLAKDPANYNVQLQMASVYATAGQKAEAIKVIRAVQTAHPEFKDQLEPYIVELSK